MFCPCFSSQTCRSMAEHLPIAGSGLPNHVRELPKVERRLYFSSPRTSSKHRSWRHAWAGQLVVKREGEVKHAAAVRMVARGCTRACLLAGGRACSGGFQHGLHACGAVERGGTRPEYKNRRDFQRGGRFLFRLGWPNRGLGSSSGTPKSPETVLTPWK